MAFSVFMAERRQQPTVQVNPSLRSKRFGGVFSARNFGCAGNGARAKQRWDRGGEEGPLPPRIFVLLPRPISRASEIRKSAVLSSENATETQARSTRVSKVFHWQSFVLSYFLKVVLSMVVVHLHESDYVAADNCYKDSFEFVKLAILHWYLYSYTGIYLLALTEVCFWYHIVTRLP